MRYLTAGNTGAKCCVDEKYYEILKRLSYTQQDTGHFIISRKNIPFLPHRKKGPMNLQRYIGYLEKPDMKANERVILLDKNPLNCTLENIKIVDVSQQLQYADANQKNKTSKYRGVSMRTRKLKNGGYNYYWAANCTSTETGKRESASFPYTSAGELEAARWYNIHACKYYGELAITNDIPEK